MQKVLIIDDSPAVVRMLMEQLASEGVELFEAHSGTEGLRKARNLRPDLILLDVEMPVLSGMEVCRILKADRALADVPVIFLTGAGDLASKVRGFELGAADYVTKPFEVPELLARVRSQLRTRSLLHLLAIRAQVDGLTGLYNRAYFDQRIRDELAAARRYRRTVSLVLADIDHFKRLNDGYGHPFGDRVLERIGGVMAQVRESDAACRYGGEEIAILLTETPLDGAGVLAEKLRDSIAGLPFEARGQRLSVTASFGVASTENESIRDENDLIAAADEALYRAKHLGRNRVVLAEARAESMSHALAAEPLTATRAR
jgi:two-component system cell cycle response regulator